MNLVKFFKSRVFFIQLGMSIVATIILIWGSTLFLGMITERGDDITVPDLYRIKNGRPQKLSGRQGIWNI